MRRWTLLLLFPLLGLAPGLALAAPEAGAKDRPAAGPESDRHWKQEVRYQKRPYLGVHLLGLTEELRAHFGAPASAGVLVSKVETGSPAAAAGVLVGDVLVAVDSQQMVSTWQVARAVDGSKAGQKVRLELVRKGSARTLEVALALRDKPTLEVSRFFFRWPPGAGTSAASSPGWDPRAFQESMDKLQERFQGWRGPEGGSYFRLKHKEQQMELRLKQLEEKLRKLEQKLQSRNTL